MTWNEFVEAATLFLFLVCLTPVVFCIVYSITMLYICGGKHEQ